MKSLLVWSVLFISALSIAGAVCAADTPCWLRFNGVKYRLQNMAGWWRNTRADARTVIDVIPIPIGQTADGPNKQDGASILDIVPNPVLAVLYRMIAASCAPWVSALDSRMGMISSQGGTKSPSKKCQPSPPRG